MAGFSVYGRMAALPGRRDELVERFRGVLGEGIAGLEWYCISTLLDDPDAIVVYQVWADRAAHDAGTRSAAVVAGTARVMELVGGPAEGSYGQVVQLGAATA